MIERSHDGPVAILAPERPRELREIGAAAGEALAAGARTLLVDLARCAALRGDEIERLADLHFQCEEAGAALALAAVSKEVRHAIDVLDLAALFPYVYPDRAGALETLRRASIAPAGEAPLEIGFDSEDYDELADPPPPIPPPPPPA
jgi:hypothetical protein